MDFKKRRWAGSLPIARDNERATITTLLQGMGLRKLKWIEVLPEKHKSVVRSARILKRSRNEIDERRKWNTRTLDLPA
jgi:hypothetical protein